jgi:hypothetical protein
MLFYYSRSDFYSLLPLPPYEMILNPFDAARVSLIIGSLSAKLLSAKGFTEGSVKDSTYIEDYLLFDEAC